MRIASPRNAFTVIEVLIVVVIMALLAAVIIPQFTDSTKDAKLGNARFNVQALRSQIELYRSHHNGLTPDSALNQLLANTDISGAKGSGASYPYGPYLKQIPTNPFNDSASITVITNDPAQSADVTGKGGWLYNPSTGGIWLDDATYYNN
jgi:prepilin-type N-terminal cleavage/methylation domain-containing protein